MHAQMHKHCHHHPSQSPSRRPSGLCANTTVWVHSLSVAATALGTSFNEETPGCTGGLSCIRTFSVVDLERWCDVVPARIGHPHVIPRGDRCWHPVHELSEHALNQSVSVSWVSERQKKAKFCGVACRIWPRCYAHEALSARA